MSSYFGKATSIAAMLAILVTFGCGGQPDSKSRQVKIGAVLPLTGPMASYGQNAKSGVDMAIEEINALGRIKLQVTYEDDAGKTQNAVSASQKLVHAGDVPLIIGEASSAVSLAIVPICNRNKVVLFSPVSSAAELSEKGGDYFFRVCPSDAFQAGILAKWLIAKEVEKISIMYVNSSWGISLKEELSTHFTRLGGIILTAETCNDGDRDFRSHITKMIAVKPDALVCFTYGKEGGAFLRQARELNVQIPIYGGDTWGVAELLEAAGEAAEGVFFTFPASPKGDKFEVFAERYVERYGKDPDVYAAYGYDLAQIAGQAFDSGVQTGEQLREYLLTMKIYVGVTGPTRFDENGDVVTKTFDRKAIKDGRYVVIE